MPTIMTHPAAALGLFPWFAKRIGRKWVLAIGAGLTMLPDLDVIGFGFGVAYGDLLGHRGLTHSLFFAAVLGGLVALLVARFQGMKPGVLWLYFSICLASHGMLDALTNGGLGIAFFSPFSNERYFWDFRPVHVSAIGIGGFFQRDWVGLLMIEARWIWAPFMALAAVGFAVARWRAGHATLDSAGQIAEAVAEDEGPDIMSVEQREVAPEFNLPADSGGTIALSLLQGWAVVLYFYPKDDTPGCTEQAIAFRDAQRAFADAGAMVVGISRDSVASHDKFKARHKLNFPLLSDEDGRTCEAYGVLDGETAERATFLIDTEGAIARSWRKVSLDGHTEAVLAAARAL
jgi:peroxiredoxin/membrane-bound metal-dependent hydrolase YbcI (DUF457 family)